jgi:hypothetical protein
MSYCEHCEGQRFDRARVLRALRRLRRQLRTEGHRHCDEALRRAVAAVKELDLPHLEVIDGPGEIIH